MCAGFVQIDDGPVFPAIIDAERWNGWAMPFFSRETVGDVLAMYGEGLDASWAGDQLVIWDCPDEDDKERVLVETVTRGGRLLYGLGAGSWVWSEAEGE